LKWTVWYDAGKILTHKFKPDWIPNFT